MREAYYYLRDENHSHPRITVCLIKDEHNFIARGIAICSLKDNPCKAEGRKYAKHNALWSIKHKKNGRPIQRNKAWNALAMIKLPSTIAGAIQFKAYYDAVPWLELETKLFNTLRN